MGGTIAGGKAAARTNTSKYGQDFYKRIGSIGGKNGRTGGFAAAVDCQKVDCEYQPLWGYHLIRQCAGAKGGALSKRRKNGI